ncbi:hypothetical protein M569_00186, partial [Genlisea aurea]
TPETVSMVRSVIGGDFSDAEITRALFMAKSDPTRAINIIFDTPGSFKRSIKSEPVHDDIVVDLTMESEGDLSAQVVKKENEFDGKEEVKKLGDEWWFVGNAEVFGLSTCKGRTLNAGDPVDITFPKLPTEAASSMAKFGGGCGRRVAACSEIVRFSNKKFGELGRIPMEWGQSLLPLVRDKKICVLGYCKYAPPVLGIMDTIVLTIRVFINSSKLLKNHQMVLKTSNNLEESSVVPPLPTLLNLIGLVPFQKAKFTPRDLYTKKRPLNNEQVNSSLPPSFLLMNKLKNDGKDADEEISENELDNIVGVSDNLELEEMEPPSTLLCELRPYQKQALYWMFHMERGRSEDEAKATLHPCWDAYRLGDKRGLIIYINSFSGEASMEFPSTLQMSRGGILADTMGLGKTIMALSLLLTHPGRDRPPGDINATTACDDNCKDEFKSDKPPFPPTAPKITNSASLCGGNLIVCPMTLIGQWKAEIEAHAQPGALSVYVHYGPGRTKDVNFISKNSVVLTTYGILSAEYSS